MSNHNRNSYGLAIMISKNNRNSYCFLIWWSPNHRNSYCFLTWWSPSHRNTYCFLTWWSPNPRNSYRITMAVPPHGQGRVICNHKHHDYHHVVIRWQNLTHARSLLVGKEVLQLACWLLVACRLVKLLRMTRMIILVIWRFFENFWKKFDFFFRFLVVFGPFWPFFQPRT